MEELLWNDLTLSSSSTTSAKPVPLTTELVFQQLSLPGTSHMLSNAHQDFHYPSNSGKKRGVDENVVEKRKKRLIKNRESAVRSRARRQAYTYELESKVAHLAEQNEKLRKQLQQREVCVAANDEVERHPEKHRLNRSSSSPF